MAISCAELVLDQGRECTHNPACSSAAGSQQCTHSLTPGTRCCRVCGESRQALTMGMLCWSCHTATPEWAAQWAKTAASMDRLQGGKVAG